MKKKKKLTLIQKRMLTGYLFILPWLIGFIYFYIRSIIMTVQFSFSELVMDTMRGGYSLVNVGFENFRHAFLVHGSFNQTLTSSIFNILIDVPLIIFFSLFVAILLNKKFPGRAIMRVIFFLPIILGSEAILASLATAEQMMGGGVSTMATEVGQAMEGGGVNIGYLIGVFLDLGIPLSILEYVITAVSRINAIISASGVQIIIFLAALQAIPGALYEVADIEGATGYETFWKVTFPIVMPHIITNIVYTIVDSFTKSHIVEMAYNTAFTNFNYGLSSVFSIVSTVVTLAILFFVVGMIQRKTFYYN